MNSQTLDKRKARIFGNGSEKRCLSCSFLQVFRIRENMVSGASDTSAFGERVKNAAE